MFRRSDSWIAAATAMTQPRIGTPIWAPTAAMVAAWPTCSASKRPTGRQPPAGADTETAPLGSDVVQPDAAPPPNSSAPPAAQATTRLMTEAMMPPNALRVIAAPPCGWA
jgi:hypothetical protein